MGNGGSEEARSVRAVCDLCVAHCNRAVIGVVANTQGSSLREDETHVPALCAMLPAAVCIWHVARSLLPAARCLPLAACAKSSPCAKGMT